MRQTADLHKRPPDPVRQVDTPLKVRLGFVDPRRPQFGDALDEAGVEQVAASGAARLFVQQAALGCAGGAGSRSRCR